MRFFRDQADPLDVRLLEDQDYKLELDVSQWIQDNAAVTSSTWTVDSGQVTVDNTSYSAPIITGYLSSSNSGVSRVQLTWTDGTATGVQNIHVRFTDKNTVIMEDEYYV